MLSWWNVSYSFRRKLLIEAPKFVTAGSPIHVGIVYETYLASNKLREDFQDIIVVRHVESATPSSNAIPCSYSQDEVRGILRIVFNAEQSFIGLEESYYLYFNNPRLANEPSVGVFTDSDYAIIATPSDYGSDLTFSRPNEDWVDGSSSMINARAALMFTGSHARLKLVTGPDKGIVELRLDSDDLIYINTYSQIEQTTIVYTTPDIDIGKHYIRLRVTGEKSPPSDNYIVEMHSFEYSNYLEAFTLGEEIYSEKGVLRTIVGS